MTADRGADRARFDGIYAANRVAILGYLLRRCDEAADAADLLAETFLVCWRRIEDVPDGDAARLWLYGVARRVLANHRRHERVEGRLADALRTQLLEELTRRGTVDHPFGPTIAQCLAALNPSDRELIELATYEQLRPSEIATVLAVNPGAVRVRLHRIRRALRTDLLRAGYPLQPPGPLRASSQV